MENKTCSPVVFHGGEFMVMMSPWGKIQNKETFARGISFVTSSGHGGYMISKGVAHKRLSPKAIELGDVYGGYYCYEEDCKYAIIQIELPEVRSELYEEEVFLKSLSRHYPEYVISRGEIPSEPEYSQYLDYKKMQQRKEQQDPDLIISAVTLSLSSKLIKVTTADNKEHLITAESYRSAKGWNKNLSDMELIEHIPDRT
jgi:hypothetical protein